MRSNKAREFLEENATPDQYRNVSLQDAIHAVEMAEKEKDREWRSHINYCYPKEPIPLQC